MSNSQETKLYRVTALTFEQLGFMLPSPDLTEEQKRAPVDAAVKVEFTGCFSGRIILSVSGGVLPYVVSNMVGEDEAFSPDALQDALGEMANVICGNLLPEMVGNREVFSLRPPERIDPASIKGEGDPDAAIHVGLDESGRADVYLFATGDVPACLEEGGA